MAVPKKRTSKMKKNKRKSVWRASASLEAQKALSKAKMVLRQLLTDLETKEEPKIENGPTAS